MPFAALLVALARRRRLDVARLRGCVEIDPLGVLAHEGRLPQSLEGQLTLLEADPERFFRPPYVGPKGWVGVVLDTSPDWAEIALLVRESYRLVATAKLRKALDAAKGQAL